GHEPVQVLVAHAIRDAGCGDARREERRLPVEQSELAEERARTDRRDDDLADPRERLAHDLDLAALDEHEVVRALARAEEVVAGLDLLRLAERAEPGPLVVGEHGRLHRVACRFGHGHVILGGHALTVLAASLAVMRIRPAVATDAPRVAEVWEAAWRDGHLGHVPEALVRHRTPES